MKFVRILVLSISVFLSACSAWAPDMGSQQDLMRSDWVLSEFPGVTIDTDHRPTFKFKPDSQVAGGASCNNYTGSLELTDTSMKLTNITTTKRLCKRSVMKVENAFLDALSQVKSWKLDMHTLRLRDSDGVTLLRFRRMGMQHGTNI